LRKKQLQRTSGGAVPNSVFVDTSAWIAFLSSRDQHHFEAEQLFRKAVAEKVRLFTTNLVIAEIHRLILHRVGAEAAASALKMIEADARIMIVFANLSHHEAAKIWLAKFLNQKLTYTDSVSFAIMQEAGCNDFLSFDNHFLAAGFQRWTGCDI
jgi:uncharacterized protein